MRSADLGPLKGTGDKGTAYRPPSPVPYPHQPSARQQGDEGDGLGTVPFEQEPLSNFRRDVAAEFEYWWEADLAARRIRWLGMIEVAILARRLREVLY